MKKKLLFQAGILAAALVSGLTLGGCGSSPKGTYLSSPVPDKAPARGASLSQPDFVRAARREAPAGSVLGIGQAKETLGSQAIGIAQNRARADIASKLQSLVNQMIIDYRAGSEVDESAAMAYQQTIIEGLTTARLRGLDEIDGDSDGNGNYWCVWYMLKADAEKAVNQAANQALAAAKLKAPKAAAMEALDQMDKKLKANIANEINEVSKEEPEVRDHD